MTITIEKLASIGPFHGLVTEQEPYRLANGEENHNQRALDAFRRLYAACDAVAAADAVRSVYETAAVAADARTPAAIAAADAVSSAGDDIVTDEMVARGCEAWDRVKYTYTSPAQLVRAILEAALKTAAALVLLLPMLGCQSTENNYYADNGATIRLERSGSSEQKRGEQAVDAVNPRVDARDNTVSGVPPL